MSALTVLEMAGQNLDLSTSLVNHDPTRTLTLNPGFTGTFVAGQTITFGTSGATGKVVSWDSPSRTLVFYLMTATKIKVCGRDERLLPWVGETVTGPSPGSGVVATLTSNGDTFVNDGRSFLYPSNAKLVPVTVVALGQREVYPGVKLNTYHEVPAGFLGPIGPFSRLPYNIRGLGTVKFEYIGSDSPSDLGVVAIRMFKSQ